MLVLKLYDQVQQRTGTKKDGTEFQVRFQEAEILRMNRRPRLVEVSSPKSGPYPEGLYTLSESAFRPDNFDRITLSPFAQLIPLSDAVQIASKFQAAEGKNRAKPK